MSAPAAVAAARPPARSTAARVLLGGLVLFTVVHLYRKAHGITFYFDEWNFVLERRAWNLGSFLEPHNEHLSLVPVLVYKLLMATVGIAGHDPYLVVLLLLHGLCGVLMFLVVRRRLGDWAAVCAAALVLFLGSGWEDVIWAFQIGYLGSLAAGLGIVLALDRGDRRGDAIACALLVVALASSGLGLPILGGVLVYLLARPDRTGRAWVWGVPLGLYAVWYLVYGKSAVRRENLTDVPGYAVEMMSSGMAGLVNQPVEIGRLLFVVGAYLLVARLSRAGQVPRALLGLLAAGLAFWCLTGLARAHLGEATISRYVYPSAIALLLIGAEAARGWRPNQVGLLAAGLVTAAAALSGLGVYHDGSVEMKKRSAATRAALGAVDIAGAAMKPDFVPDGVQAPQVAVGPYREAVRAYGESPAWSVEQIKAARPAERGHVDTTLIAGLSPALADEPGEPAGSAPAADPAPDGSVEADGPCLRFSPSRPGGGLTFPLPGSGVRIASEGAAAAKVALRRYGDEPRPIGDVPAQSQRVLRVTEDRAPDPWRVTVTADQPVEVCGL